MFQSKDVIGEAVKKAVELFKTQKRGDVVSWEAIEEIAGFDRLSPHWATFNKRFRRDFLNETGIEVWPVNGSGLQLCTKEFQLKVVPIKRERKAHRQFTKSLNAVKAMPDEQLTDHQRAVKYKQIEQLRRARRAVRYSIKLGHILAKPTRTGIPHSRPALA